MKNYKYDLEQDYSNMIVPASARKSFLPMLFLMLGFVFNSGCMSVGAKLGTGLDLSGFFAALV